jgi:hypothetical protein
LYLAPQEQPTIAYCEPDEIKPDKVWFIFTQSDKQTVPSTYVKNGSFHYVFTPPMLVAAIESGYSRDGKPYEGPFQGNPSSI